MVGNDLESRISFSGWGICKRKGSLPSMPVGFAFTAMQPDVLKEHDMLRFDS